MTSIGFKLRHGAETFFIDHDWSPLQPVKLHGRKIGNVEFNHMFGLPQLYQAVDSFSAQQHAEPLTLEQSVAAVGSAQEFARHDVDQNQVLDPTELASHLHMRERVPQVIEMAKSGKAKIQYFQLYYMFDQVGKS